MPDAAKNLRDGELVTESYAVKPPAPLGDSKMVPSGEKITAVL
jgi:hypothetical protein